LKTKYGPKCELIYADTNSLLDIQTEDVTKGIIWWKTLVCMTQATIYKTTCCKVTEIKRFWAR